MAFDLAVHQPGGQVRMGRENSQAGSSIQLLIFRSLSEAGWRGKRFSARTALTPALSSHGESEWKRWIVNPNHSRISGHINILSEHSKSATRTLHYIGTLIALFLRGSPDCRRQVVAVSHRLCAAGMVCSGRPISLWRRTGSATFTASALVVYG